MPTRTGTRPLRAMTLLNRGSISPSEAFQPKMASMTTYALSPAPVPDLEPYLKVAYAAFLDTLGASEDEDARKIAASPPSFDVFQEMVKQSGLMDNLKAWGGYFKNKVTGGDFANQMRGLTGGASSGMSGLRETINPGLQQIKGPGELALRHQAQVQQAANIAAARPHSPEAFGLPVQAAPKLSPDAYLRSRAAASAPMSPEAFGLSSSQRPQVAPGAFLRSQATPQSGLGAFGRDPNLGERAARLRPALVLPCTLFSKDSARG